MRRRDALVIGGAMAVAVAIPPVLRRLPSRFAFEPLPGFDGFRRLAGGATSGAVNPFVGLDGRLPTPSDPAAIPTPPPCPALFGPAGWQGETVPVAVFSDFNCPYCRIVEDLLLSLEASDARIRLIWHEMPLLGDASYQAARGVLAARVLGQEREARRYLWSHPMPPGEIGLRRLADALSLDSGAMIRAAQSAAVANALAESLSLGARLGIYGTPGTMVGRTLLIGAIKEADLRKLIALEREEPRTICL